MNVPMTPAQRLSLAMLAMPDLLEAGHALPQAARLALECADAIIAEDAAQAARPRLQVVAGDDQVLDLDALGELPPW